MRITTSDFRRSLGSGLHSGLGVGLRTGALSQAWAGSQSQAKTDLGLFYEYNLGCGQIFIATGNYWSTLLSKVLRVFQLSVKQQLSSCDKANKKKQIINN